MSQLQDSPSSGMAQCEITGKWVPEDEIVDIQGKRVCAEGKQILLDRLKAGATLPGELEPPGVLRRWGCSILDGIILWVPFMAISFGIGFALLSTAANSVTEALLQGLISILYALLATLYFTFLHARGGQSLGKKVGKIKVVRLDGSPISTTQAFWRAFFFTGLGIIPGLVVMASMGNELAMGVAAILNLVIGVYAIVSIIMLLIDRKQQQALHDRFVGTRVIMVD